MQSQCVLPFPNILQVTRPQAPCQTQNGSRMPNNGIIQEFGARSQLSALEGVKGRAEALGLDQEEGQLSCYTILHPKPTISWLELILHPFGCWDKPRALGLTRLTTARIRGKPPPSLLQYSLQLRAEATSKWLFFSGLPR